MKPLSCTLSLSRQLVTCGHDCDIRIFPSIIEDDDCTEFTLTADKILALVCYPTPGGTDTVAVAIENTVQAFKLDVSEGKSLHKSSAFLYFPNDARFLV